MLEYHIDPARNLVVTRVIGRVTVADAGNQILRLMRDPAFKPELNALVLVADESAVPGPIVVSALTPLVRAWSKHRTGAKWAFVLPNRSTRDFIEAAIAEARLHTVTTRCFTSESAARAWLEPQTVAPVPFTPSVAAATTVP